MVYQMSSIKRFDDYSYKELDYKEFKKEFCKIVEFSNYEITDIKNKLSSCKIDYKLNNISLFTNINGEFSNVAKQLIISKDGIVYTISKKTDEYYLVEETLASQIVYVNRKSEYYICDQYDELLKFFKDKNLLSDTSINESVTNNGDVWVVICTSYDGDIDEVKTFSNELSAADCYINLVNELFYQEFEPMKEDGERLFSDPNQNEDYIKAIKYVNTHTTSLRPIKIIIII